MHTAFQLRIHGCWWWFYLFCGWHAKRKRIAGKDKVHIKSVGLELDPSVLMFYLWTMNLFYKIRCEDEFPVHMVLYNSLFRHKIPYNGDWSQTLTIHTVPALWITAFMIRAHTFWEQHSRLGQNHFNFCTWPLRFYNVWWNLWFIEIRS